MLIPIVTTNSSEISNIEFLESQIRNRGGRVVEYRWIFSFVILTVAKSKYEWLPEEASRSKSGIKHALFCALLGWWSLPGFFATPGIVLNNLIGGVDVTKLLFPTRTDGGIEPEVLAELAKAQKRQQIIQIGCLLLIFAIICYYCIVPLFNKP